MVLVALTAGLIGAGANPWGSPFVWAPLLAADPHLGTSVPSAWMQMGLHCRTVSPDCPLDVSGFSLSGVPGIVVGHNADIAWGFASLGADVSDLYLERIEGDRWRYDGRWRALRTRTETIRVRGGDDVTVAINRADSALPVSIPAGAYRDLLRDENVDGGSLSLPARSFRVLGPR